MKYKAIHLPTGEYLTDILERKIVDTYKEAVDIIYLYLLQQEFSNNTIKYQFVEFDVVEIE